jgi:hypothetical protein
MLLFHDTPDYYTTALMSRYWDTVHADAIVDPNDGYGGGGAISASSANGYVIKYHDQTGQSAFSAGMRFKATSNPGADKAILAVVDAAGTIQVCLALESDGKLAVYRGALSAQLGITTDAIDLSTQLDIGFKGVVGSVGGSAEVWLGTAGDSSSWTRVIAISGENTAGGSGEVHRGLYVGSTTVTFSSHLYLRDGQGADTDVKPGHKVTAYRPTSNGVFTGYAANSGSMYAAIDDTAADDDTTYIQTSTQNASFTVGLGSVSSAGVIYGVEAIHVVKNTAAGAGMTYTPRLVLNADTAPIISDSNWRAASSADWRVFVDRRPVNPLTGLPWTAAQLNAAEWGGLATS